MSSSDIETLPSSDNHQIWGDTMSPQCLSTVQWLVTTPWWWSPSKHSQLMPCVTMEYGGNPMRNIQGIWNVKLRVDLETSSVFKFLNYHNVKSETNQPICKSYKRIFYGRRFHPYILNTWYLNHLICISKKHYRYFEQLDRNADFQPSSIRLIKN